MNLKGKKVLITGATGGIGFCLVEKFSSYGCKILATGTNEQKLNNLKEKFKNIYTLKFELDNHEKIEEFVETSSKELDGLDVLINNAVYFDNLSIRLTEEIEKSFKHKFNFYFSYVQQQLRRC